MCTGSSAESESPRVWSRTRKTDRAAATIAASAIARRPPGLGGPGGPPLGFARTVSAGRPPPRLERVADERGQSRESVPQADFLPLRRRASEIGDRDLED